MQKINYDIVSSILFIIVSAIALWETRGLSEMSYVFPRTAGTILLVLSVVYFIVSLRKSPKEKAFGDINKVKVLIMTIGMILYVVLIGFFGFLIASLLYIALICWYLQKDDEGKSSKAKWIHSILTSALVTLVFFGLFKYVFLVPLPAGLFFGG